MELYNQVCFKSSKIITQEYSTSFSIGILALDKRFRNPIRGIYGFVRLADEIVDTFHAYDKKTLLEEFMQQTWQALDRRISTNPVLQSFQHVVHQYGIDRELIQSFFDSMETDLYKQTHGDKSYDTYIYGSAETVGLMCLKVFVEGDQEKYLALETPARRLGAAFQKVNFLRDLRSDYQERGRIYFPNVGMIDEFTDAAKQRIEHDIIEDFRAALKGIAHLPAGSKLGVYIAYRYFYALLFKIKELSSKTMLQQRIRVATPEKTMLFFNSYLKYITNRI